MKTNVAARLSAVTPSQLAKTFLFVLSARLDFMPFVLIRWAPKMIGSEKGSSVKKERSQERNTGLDNTTLERGAHHFTRISTRPLLKACLASQSSRCCSIY